MKVQRQITKNGNSTGVSIPPAMLDAIGLHGGDAVIVELTEDYSIRVRPVQPADLQRMQPMSRNFPANATWKLKP